jgi:hypothetical protein
VFTLVILVLLPLQLQKSTYGALNEYSRRSRKLGCERERERERGRETELPGKCDADTISGLLTCCPLLCPVKPILYHTARACPCGCRLLLLCGQSSVHPLGPSEWEGLNLSYVTGISPTGVATSVKQSAATTLLQIPSFVSYLRAPTKIYFINCWICSNLRKGYDCKFNCF